MGNLKDNKRTLLLEDSMYDDTKTIDNKKTMILQETLDRSKKTMVLEEVQSGSKRTMLLDNESDNLSIYNLNLSDIIGGKYKILRLLPVDSGEGEFYIAEYNGEEYIVKFFNLNYKYNEEKTEKLSGIKSKFVVKIVDSGVYKGRIYEVMRYYKNGDLTKYKLSRDFIKKILIPNVIDALNDIHSNNIIHRDIKPSNIFLSNDESYVLLSDFGISSILTDKATSKKTGQSKTIEYSAIETFNGIVTSASDYYSLGITIMELLTGKTSYEGLDVAEMINRKFKHKLNIPLANDDEFYHLIRGLTVVQYKNRWGYEEVKRWLNGEYVEIKEYNVDSLVMAPYKFNGKKITSKKELALELSLNWEDGIKDLRRRYLSEYFINIDIEITRKLDDIIEKMDNIYQEGYYRKLAIDIEYFKAINIIYEDNPMIWRGKDLGDFNNLIEIMKNYPDVDGVDDFILEGPLEFYLEVKNYPKEIKDRVRELIKLSKISSDGYDRACYGFALLNNTDFKYKNEIFNNINDLIDYISANISEYNNIADDLLKSNYFNMWLRKLGYEEVVSNCSDYWTL